MKKLLLASAIAIVGFAAQATTLNSVKDERGNLVRSTEGTCVRHEWDKSNDVCAKAEPKPEPAPTPVVQEPAPAVSPAKQLKVEDRTVYFDFDKSNLTSEAQAKLDSLAEVLKSDTEVKLASIVGYADKMGSTEYNDALSQKRAAAVQNYLAEKGFVKTELAKTEWVGESKPSTDCEEPKAKKSKKKAKKSDARAKAISCLAPDRKVEVRIDFEE